MVLVLAIGVQMSVGRTGYGRLRVSSSAALPNDGVAVGQRLFAILFPLSAGESRSQAKTVRACRLRTERELTPPLAQVPSTYFALEEHSPVNLVHGANSGCYLALTFSPLICNLRLS